MQSDCANLQSDLVLVTLMSSMSWKGTEKWSINQPRSSLAYFQNILEVQALVSLSPHLNQKIISSKGHEHYVTGLLQFSVRTMKLTPVSTPTPSVCGSTYPCWALGAGATTKR